MFARLARIMGDRLAAALELPPKEADKAAFALENLFLYFTTFGAVIIAAMLLGLLGPALAASLSGAFLRAVSGGAHLSRPGRCLLVSTLLALGFGWAGRAVTPHFIPPLLAALAVLVGIVGAVLLFFYAPAETPAKPIPPVRRRKLKIASFIFLGLWLGWFFIFRGRQGLPAAGLFGLAWQLLTITPAGYRLYHFLDRVADGLTGRKGGE